MRLLQTTQAKSGLSEAESGISVDAASYRKLGFSGEIPALEGDFAEVGLFGLYTLYYLAINRPDEFSTVS